jgi:hypothetical protein
MFVVTVRARFRRVRSIGALAAFALAGASACEPGPLPMDLSVNDPGAAPGNTAAKNDSIEILVKTLPGAEVRYDGETKNLGEHATETFVVPKSKLRVGTNSFSVDGTAGSFLTKKAGTATVTWNAGVKEFVRVASKPPAGDSGGALSCASILCASPGLAMTKKGTLPLAITSAVAGTVRVADVPAPVMAGVPASVEVDLAPRAFDLPAVDEPKITLPVALDTGPGLRATESLELGGGPLVDLAVGILAQVEAGPVAIPRAGGADAAPPGPPRLLALVGVPGHKVLLVSAPGAGATFRDIDLVAVAHKSERVFGCDGGTEILYADLLVGVFDRRSGKKLTDKTLKADRVPCPPAGAARAGTKLEGVVREGDLKAVLGEVLRGKGL